MDTFAPIDPPELFSPLLRTLRQVGTPRPKFTVPSLTCTNTQALPDFRRVVHVYDETSNQAFFLNTDLLLENVYILGDAKEEDGIRVRSDGWVDWVSLETPPVLVGICTSSPLHINEAQALSFR